jgi:hypothetical protein
VFLHLIRLRVVPGGGGAPEYPYLTGDAGGRLAQCPEVKRRPVFVSGRIAEVAIGIPCRGFEVRDGSWTFVKGSYEIAVGRSITGRRLTATTKVGSGTSPP